MMSRDTLLLGRLDMFPPPLAAIMEEYTRPDGCEILLALDAHHVYNIWFDVVGDQWQLANHGPLHVELTRMDDSTIIDIRIVSKHGTIQICHTQHDALWRYANGEDREIADIMEFLRPDFVAAIRRGLHMLVHFIARHEPSMGQMITSMYTTKWWCHHDVVVSEKEP